VRHAFHHKNIKLGMIITKHRFHVLNKWSPFLYRLLQHDMWWKIEVVMKKFMSLMEAVEEVELQSTLSSMML
jgi:hypothetical protein